MKPKLSEIMVHLIRKTGNLFAPLLMNKLASSLKNAKVLFPCEQAAVEQVQARLLSDFPDDEINTLSSKPEFIIALMILLEASLVGFSTEDRKD